MLESGLLRLQNCEKARILHKKMARLAGVAPNPPQEEGGGDERMLPPPARCRDEECRISLKMMILWQ
jgi:hypothetical protein